MPKCDFNKVALQSNFIEIALRHGCSTVNLLYIFRTPFPRNTSGRLLLEDDFDDKEPPCFDTKAKDLISFKNQRHLPRHTQT